MKASELVTRQPRTITLHSQRGTDTIQTYLTDREALLTLQAAERAGRLSSFGLSLVNQAGLRGLSPRQWPWVHKLALDELPASCRPGYVAAPAREASPAPVAATLDLASIRTMLQHAQAKGIKFPRIAYRLDQGKLQIAMAGARSKAPGSITVTDGGGFDNGQFYGRVALDGAWQPSRSCPAWVLDALRGLAADPAGFSAAYGQRTGHCCFCSRELTTNESNSVGYGPVCADKYGLPWGEVTIKTAAEVMREVAPAPQPEAATAAPAGLVVKHVPGDNNTSEHYDLLDASGQAQATVWVNRLLQHTALSCGTCRPAADCAHVRLVQGRQDKARAAMQARQAAPKRPRRSSVPEAMQPTGEPIVVPGKDPLYF
jgi:hypothetical protein